MGRPRFGIKKRSIGDRYCAIDCSKIVPSPGGLNVTFTSKFTCAPRRIRTFDLRIRSPLLYPAELGALTRQRKYEGLGVGSSGKRFGKIQNGASQRFGSLAQLERRLFWGLVFFGGVARMPTCTKVSGFRLKNCIGGVKQWLERHFLADLDGETLHLCFFLLEEG